VKRTLVRTFAEACVLALMACAPACAQQNAVVWRAGDPQLGRWIPASTYQCGMPSVDRSAFAFMLKRNGDSCGRNQANPVDADGDLVRLAEGSTYEWTFTYEDRISGSTSGMGPDARAQALIFQIHGMRERGTPCTALGFGNGEDGAQVWTLTSCANGVGHPYWTGSYVPGERDRWRIVARVSDGPSGFLRLYRNGALVANETGANYRDSSGAPWWNFGIYAWRWELPDGGGSTMSVKRCVIDGMTLMLAP
jgi:hypothetical protein